MALGVTGDDIKRKRAELDCSLQTAQLECEREAAEAILTRELLCKMDWEMPDRDEIRKVLSWLVERAK